MVTITRISLNRGRFFIEEEEEQVVVDSIMRIWSEGAIFHPAYRNGHWDGFIRLYDKANEFDLGLTQELRQAFKENDINCVYNIEYEKVPINQEQLVFDEDDREYQSEAVRKFFKNNVGIVIVPTRGGKTFIATSAVKNLQYQIPECQVMFIVDGVDLFNQTIKEFAKFLKIDENELGKINAKEFNPQNVTIAMVQTLNSIYFGKKKDAVKLKALNSVMRKLTMLIVDEVQDTSSQKRLNIYNKATNLKFLMGLSATPFRNNDILSALKVKGFFGGVAYNVEKKTLQKEGYLSMDKAILISNQIGRQLGATSYHDYLRLSIHENNKRNMILVNIVKLCKRNKIKALFLFNSKIHGNIVSELTNCVFISGDDKTEEREKQKVKFLEKKGGILLASNIYKKGITLPEVELVVISDGGLEQINVQQKFGRVLGATDTKTRSIVIDILDVGSKYFSKHSLERLELYDEQIGKNRIEIYNDGDWIEIEESIVEWLSENNK